MKRTHSNASTSIVRRLMFISLYVLGGITIFFIILLFIPRPSYKEGFVTLDQITAYTKTIDEKTPFVGDNTIKPDFSPYYKTLESNWRKSLKEKLVWLGSFIKISKSPAWSPSFFKTQLEELTKTRQENKMKGDFVCKITPGSQSKIVVFGNTQGAFHSLARNLVKLKELNVIDQNLKVANPDHCIVFLGDIVSRSAFSMQTLSLVMRLIQANPNNVIYLRGNHESNNYWQEHTLKTELQTLAAHLDKNIVPLAEAVNAFFNTLPLGAYITIPSENSSEFIRISDAGRTQNNLLNELNYSKFLFTKATGTTYLPITETMKESDDKEPNIRVIFKGEKKRETFQPTQGIRLLPSDMGSVAWNVLSCPTAVYQKALKFFHDAFAIITPADKTDAWTLTLYNRDVRTQDSFKDTVFNLLSGTEQATGKAAPMAEPTEKEKTSAHDRTQEEKPKDKAKEKTEKPKEEKPITKETKQPARPEEMRSIVSKDSPFDSVTTSTVASHVREIGKNARQLAEHAEAIAAAISKIQLPEDKKNTTKGAGKDALKSAFEHVEES